VITGYDAIILAGGRGARLGAPSKPDLHVAGRRMLDIALAAAGSANRIVVVGDVDVPDHVLRTREEPVFGGPVAGLAAGLAALTSPAEWLLLLACDLPDAEAAVARLLTAGPTRSMTASACLTPTAVSSGSLGATGPLHS